MGLDLYELGTSTCLDGYYSLGKFIPYTLHIQITLKVQAFIPSSKRPIGHPLVPWPHENGLCFAFGHLRDDEFHFCHAIRLKTDKLNPHPTNMPKPGYSTWHDPSEFQVRDVEFILKNNSSVEVMNSSDWRSWMIRFLFWVGHTKLSKKFWGRPWGLQHLAWNHIWASAVAF